MVVKSILVYSGGIKRSGNVFWVILMDLLPSAEADNIKAEQCTLALQRIYCSYKKKTKRNQFNFTSKTCYFTVSGNALYLHQIVFLVPVFSQNRGSRTAQYHCNALTVRFCWRFLMIIYIVIAARVWAACSFQQDQLAVALLLLHSVIRTNGSQMCVIGSALLVYACCAATLSELLTRQHIVCCVFHLAAVCWVIPDSCVSVGSLKCARFNIQTSIFIFYLHSYLT